MTDEVFEQIRRYVDAVPPATAATLDAARQRWEGPTVSLGEFVAPAEESRSADLPLLRPQDRPSPRTARQRSLRLSTMVVAACLVAVTLVVGVTIDRHLSSSSVHRNFGAAATPALCSKGPYLEFTDELNGHGLYPLAVPYQLVVLQPVTGSGVAVTDLVPGPLASVFIWRDGVWNADTPLPVPAPNSGAARSGPAIVQFTDSYPRGQRYLLQVPFAQPPAATSGAKPASRLLLCITLVISEPTPGVTTTETG